MSDIDVDDTKSEILDVGDEGSDHITDEEVRIYYHSISVDNLTKYRWNRVYFIFEKSLNPGLKIYLLMIFNSTVILFTRSKK